MQAQKLAKYSIRKDDSESNRIVENPCHKCQLTKLKQYCSGKKADSSTKIKEQK